jgi:hypothetical protein
MTAMVDTYIKLVAFQATEGMEAGPPPVPEELVQKRWSVNVVDIYSAWNPVLG